MKDWKMVMIVFAGIVSVILACVFGIQGSRNKAIALEETVETARTVGYSGAGEAARGSGL